MILPLIVGGNALERNTIPLGSLFYETYRYEAAQAGLLETSAAIGCARKARVGTVEERARVLRSAAERISYDDEALEHTVRMTGVPLSLAAGLFADFARWLREVPELLDRRYERAAGETAIESIQAGLARWLIPEPGFCYAVLPGNDPRSAALAAANLVYLGIPFILKASNKDCVAPLVVRALLAGGLDPNFCSLLYFDNAQAARHFQLVDASRAVWSFGPRQAVDRLLRWENLRPQAVIDLNPSADEPVEDYLKRAIAQKEFRIEEARRDHFEDKLIVRHDSGNCAAIYKGPLAEADRDWLEGAIRYPQGCTATKSVFVIDGPGWVKAAGGILAELRPGDPLDIRTQVGYIDAATLDHLDRLVRGNRLRANFIGGERLSPFQARPLLVAGQEPAQVFYTDEIPAYVLAVRSCADTEQAVDEINRYTKREPRLAVSLHHLASDEQIKAWTRIRAHAILVDRPTGDIVPIFHEGNDYTNRFQPGRIVVR